MIEIKNLDNILKSHPKWHPSHIAFIKEFSWLSGDVIITCYSQVNENGISWPDLSRLFFETKIIFRTTTEFLYKTYGGNIQQVTGFDIIDVSDRGLEGINFEIEDYEGGIIQFCCKDVEIIEVSEPFLLN